ncbi:hypothetical protein JVU11DRAFT_11980 [Chiua virens]|nr:hypothetical protein JVU11DRAFT_11980 [Chiua virens]
MISSNNGNQTVPSMASRLMLACPSAGGADPSVSLAALWGYILPALDHIVCSPTNSSKAPAIEPSYHMGIHDATYRYLISQSTATGPAPKHMSGKDLYDRLDKYYADRTGELLLGAPKTSLTLVQYVISCFKRYSIGAHAVSRLLDYVNRTYVNRAVEGSGIGRPVEEGNEESTKTLKGRNMKELPLKWGPPAEQ